MFIVQIRHPPRQQSNHTSAIAGGKLFVVHGYHFGVDIEACAIDVGVNPSFPLQLPIYATQRGISFEQQKHGWMNVK
jgi:hypothetical protein